ncbi:MAG TPA: TonB-dependent receptor [Puia sp.]|uniref:SusC/RagA family TonB-linked outer membrane protein n=1 Tax=Puia sp. TaxID=2045100 RepID=UPI002B9DF7F4|nr:TonB-dependent receptor [Puia sp.]HVU95753.1 TonB-dependent receptor [Puia sp.]
MPSKTNGACKGYGLGVIALLLSFSLFAQTTITGRVIGKLDNQPVLGATVQVKGSKAATSTGADGTFSLKLPGNNANPTLVITAIGFEQFQIPVAGRTSLGDLSLTQSNSTLNDVIVTGYTAQKKKDITGAVAVVDIKNMKSVPGSTTESLLQGQAAGVTVINSGQPGGGSNVRIRGITSNGNVDPLVIVDGVQGSLHDLNQADIESIQVLKDAGATAIYGVQGSNGVIVVTTKRGKGKATITYDGFYGTQRPLKNGFRLGGSQNYADVLWLESYNEGTVPGNLWFGKGGATYAPPTLPDYLSPTPYSDANGTPNPSYTANQNPGAYDIVNNQITKTNKVGTDWFHEIFKPAPWQQHSISASGSSDKSSYYFSLNYLNDQGTLIDTYLKRYAVRANTVFNVKNHVRIGENAYIFFKENPQITNQNEGNAISYAYRIPPLVPVYDVVGNYAGTHSFTINNSAQPVAVQERQKDNKGNDWQISGNVFAEVDFLNHFTARSSVGGTVDNYYYYYFNYTPYENAEGSTAQNGFTEGGGYNNTVIWTNTLNYSQTFGDHSLKVLVGTEAKNYSGRGLQGQRANYFSTNPDYWTLETGSPSTQANRGLTTAYNAGDPYQNSIWSYLGRLDYAFKDKYLVSGTLRRDASSKFSPGHQVGWFPSVSLGWRISQEDFMKDVTWLNDLKLRGSWGKSGNLGNVNSTNPYNLFGSNAYNSYYDISGSSTGSTLGFYASNLGNPATTWEKDNLTDVGVDFTVKHFDVTVDWFKKSISGLLFTSPGTAFIGGAALPQVNLGDIQNVGFDGSITYHGQVNRDFHFDITGTFTHYSSKVISLPPGIKYVDYTNAGSNRIGSFTRFQPGQPIGEFYGYKVDGYFKDDADVQKSPTQANAAPGFFKYDDVNHSGAITDSDRTWIGNPNPKLTYGLNLAASYKGFDFAAFFYGSYGQDIFNYVKYWTALPQVFQGNVYADLIQNSWSPTNLNPKYPKISTVSGFSNTNVINSWYVEKGSYLRLKSLTIGYTIDPNLLKRVGIDRLRIYLQGANLFTVTPYKGLDPELQGANLSDQTNFGIDLGNYPANQKTYVLGINLTF